MDQNGDDLDRKAEIAVDAEENFQFLRRENAAKTALRFADHAGKLRVDGVFARDIGLGVVRGLGGHKVARLRLGIEPHLPQRRGGIIQLALGKAQRRPGLGGVAAGMEIEVQQRCVRAGRRKQTANLLRGDHEILIGHGGGSFLFFFFLKNHHYSTEFSLRQGSMSGRGVKIPGKETKRLQFS